jgi:hypothetical protein
MKRFNKFKNFISSRQTGVPELLLDAHEVRRLLKCSLPLVYRMAERGQIPCVRWECPGEGKKKLRTMVRFKREDVYSFIENHYRST